MTRQTLLLILLAAFAVPACHAQDGQAPQNDEAAAAPANEDLKKRLEKAVDRSLRFIRGYQDPKTGSLHFAKPFSERTRHPGFTALAVVAYANSHRKYRSDDGPFVRNALERLASLQKKDGSIFERDSANYVTSIALSAFASVGEERWQPVMEKARDFIVNLQAREDTGYRPGDKFYGGVGYGGDERPDLSNAQFAIEAVRAAGLPEDHPFYKRALKFLERSQNWSETNDQVWKDAEGNEVRPGNDGGAIYLPGESKAGVEVLADGRRVFRSYGSMSYALLKSYVFCGVDRNDPRVKAVRQWCADHFDVDVHPGFKVGGKGNEQYQGLYYYYMSMAKSLRAFGPAPLVDSEGTKHDWVTVLGEKLMSLQREDGSFLNEKNGRWQEASDVLCTCYGVIAMEEVLAAMN